MRLTAAQKAGVRKAVLANIIANSDDDSSFGEPFKDVDQYAGWPETDDEDKADDLGDACFDYLGKAIQEVMAKLKKVSP